ncbi:hypothetical protein PoB_000240600 [Plakobranchus ocellatus]|uniref:Uncharacterized protein n=1 Tax=Plakobranchus ocellatus TaxID=259542 RepID=A0AAV3XYJ7_9GAST|nr:hypothetical protein PoB_000240600 [Plakobranchus ocellatus]
MRKKRHFIWGLHLHNLKCVAFNGNFNMEIIISNIKALEYKSQYKRRHRSSSAWYPCFYKNTFLNDCSINLHALVGDPSLCQDLTVGSNPRHPESTACAKPPVTAAQKPRSFDVM